MLLKNPNDLSKRKDLLYSDLWIRGSQRSGTVENKKNRGPGRKNRKVEGT